MSTELDSAYPGKERIERSPEAKCGMCGDPERSESARKIEGEIERSSGRNRAEPAEPRGEQVAGASGSGADAADAVEADQIDEDKEGREGDGGEACGGDPGGDGGDRGGDKSELAGAELAGDG